MKNFIIILVIIVVLVVGYKTISKNRSEETLQSPRVTTEQQQTPNAGEQIPTEQTEMIKQTMVEYAESGFEPKTLTIPTGTTVTFTNNSDSSLWVASNPHPAHIDLSTFDQKEGVEKGKSYSFTFTQKGAWGYHNHRMPKDKGVVVVE